MVIADIHDDDSLKSMAEKTKCVINCCGPYRFLGEAVVKACIAAGTHHVDVSGEPQYMEKVQLEQSEEAEKKGVYVVSACGKYSYSFNKHQYHNFFFIFEVSIVFQAIWALCSSNRSLREH